ncbi:hypothetical protein FIBSPDRAFT_873589 [Athelia psychrophila]|uniref:Uncharacterized protein n=1 Tax=Athelia psychrophila TaxID=1759441 RepID=A0A167TR04_9AGAM|nr:hypothetical protein FIBSPDRAFT_879685 [Fibularhizoctonia sp. CBS 109695]KZP09426.1 hypothetical protein FIBSPDRAFT_873589 [Fibularhizoctonia sp. CBS 109695]
MLSFRTAFAAALALAAFKAVHARPFVCPINVESCPCGVDPGLLPPCYIGSCLPYSIAEGVLSCIVSPTA